MTISRQSHDHDPPGSGPEAAPLRERWAATYGAEIARGLEPDRRYSLVRAGDAEYAFTSYDRYVAALKHAWKAGLVPEALPSAHGSQLLEVAPNLRALDPELDEL
jgi:hypothetical protein